MNKKIQKEHLKNNNYCCLQLVFRGRMKNEAKRKCKDVETEQFSSGNFKHHFQEVCVNLYTELTHCWVTTVVALLSS